MDGGVEGTVDAWVVQGGEDELVHLALNCPMPYFTLSWPTLPYFTLKLPCIALRLKVEFLRGVVVVVGGANQ